MDDLPVFVSLPKTTVQLAGRNPEPGISFWDNQRFS
jgi:hypothetical protein